MTLRFPTFQITFLLTLAVFGLCRMVFGESLPGIEDPVATETWLLQVLNFASTVKGMSALAIAAGVAQLLMVGFKTPLASFAGKFRLIAVAVFSTVSLILAAMAMGLDLGAAIGQAPVLTSLQVLLHQIWKQFFLKEE